MDLIFINDLVLSGRHGARPHEKDHPQRFSIDIEAAAETVTAAASDDLVDALDYTPFRAAAREVIETESHNLIERIAHRIADRILESGHVASVSIRLRKLDIWGNGTPGIKIFRTR
jgi:dihydroneopterin aldolase